MGGFKRIRVPHLPNFEKAGGKEDELNFTFARDFLDTSANLKPVPIFHQDSVDLQNSTKLLQQPPFVVASGEVIDSSATSSLGNRCPDVKDVKPVLHIFSSVHSPFSKLRRTSKPDRFNEDFLFAKSVRKAVETKNINEIIREKKAVQTANNTEGIRTKKAVKLTETEAGIKRGRGRPRKTGKRDSHGGNESVKLLDQLNLTPNTPVPKFLVEIYAKNFGVNEDGLESKPRNPPPPICVRPNGKIMDWDEFLMNPNNLALIPPVTSFRKAPFADIWEEIAVPGLAIELLNVFATGEFYWVGSIVHFAGYRALVRFEDFGTNPGHQYICWISFCSLVPKPVGWCANNGKTLKAGPIVPRRSLSSEELEANLMEFRQRRTISLNHVEKLQQEFQTCENKWNAIVPIEGLDPSLLTQSRLGRIAAIAGDRVQVLYSLEDSDDEEYYADGFWYHFKSEKLQPLMWSHAVGARGGYPGNYDMQLPALEFPSWPSHELQLERGMKLEVRHPYLFHKLVAAEVTEVYRYGYLMVCTLEKDSLSRLRVLYHVTSPYVLPIGFGEHNGVEVDHEDDFYENAINDVDKWNRLLPRPDHQFKAGQKVEAFKECESHYLGPATVKKIAGHLLLIHFDGWKTSVGTNYQWMDAESHDICPPGYAEMMGFLFQGPVKPSEDQGANLVAKA